MILCIQQCTWFEIYPNSTITECKHENAYVYMSGNFMYQFHSELNTCRDVEHPGTFHTWNVRIEKCYHLTVLTSKEIKE